MQYSFIFSRSLNDTLIYFCKNTEINNVPYRRIDRRLYYVYLRDTFATRKLISRDVISGRRACDALSANTSVTLKLTVMELQMNPRGTKRGTR